MCHVILCVMSLQFAETETTMKDYLLSPPRPDQTGVMGVKTFAGDKGTD